MEDHSKILSDKILKNLHYLSENLSNLPVLINLLLEERILTNQERDTINAHLTPYEKGTELWNIIRKKGQSLPKVLNCLQVSGNTTIKEKLLQKETEIILEETSQIWFNVLPTRRHFCGREEELKIIEKLWNYCYQSKRLVIVSLTGLGGVGKTEIARRKAEIFHIDIKGHVIWIDAATNQSTLSSIQDLAKKLLIPLTNVSHKEKHLSELFTDIYSKLLGTKCLFILDNVESHDDEIIRVLRDVVNRQCPSILKPLVLVTSRCGYIGTSLIDMSHNIVVKVLSEQAANDYLSLCLAVRKDEKDTFALLAQISKELQFLPLALNQAVAYIVKEQSTLTKVASMKRYLEKLSTEMKQTLSQSVSDISPTFFTWKVTLEKIQKSKAGVDAMRVIRSLSFFSPDNISLNFVLDILNSEIHYRDSDLRAIKLLCDYSMCTLLDDSLQIHRLVQEVIQIQMKEENIWQDILNQLLQNMYNMLRSKLIPLCQVVHVKSVWEHSIKEDNLTGKYEDFPTKIFQFYHEGGRHREALEFCNDAISLLASKYKANNRIMLKMMFCKGSVLENLGDYNEALNIQLNTHEIQKNNFGDEDNDCLETSREIGLIYYRVKDYCKAKEWTKSTIIKREKVKNDETNQRELLGLQNNLALICCDEGRFDEAIAILERVLYTKIELFGKDHFGTLLTLHNIGTVKFDLKQYSEALQAFKEVIQGRKNKQEENHPETLKTKLWIAKTNYKLGNYQESHNLAQELWPKFKELNSSGAREIENLITKLSSKVKQKKIPILFCC